MSALSALHAKERTRVAVIDDDAAFRTLLVEALGQRGYLARAVDNPEQAEESVKIFGAQVVLCDIFMPGGNGLDLTRRLKRRDPATQIILMTGHASQETVDEAFALGISAYLLKPLSNLQEVFAAVDRAAQGLREFEEHVREAIRREFPHEYSILYAGPDGVPPPQDIESLIAQVEEAAAAGASDESGGTD